MLATAKPARISAVIPCYNDGRSLSRAIIGVLAQTYRVDEIIIVDDGSVDNTPEVAATFGERVRYIYQDHHGAAAARNAGIRAASGDWVALLDAEDWWLREKIELQLQALAQQPDAVVVYTSVIGQRHDGSNEVVDATDPRRLWPALRSSNCVTGSASAALVRRDVLLAEGGFNEDLRVCEDWDCWVRLVRKYPFAAVSDPVTVLTLASCSASHDNDRMLTGARKLIDTTLLADLAPWRRSVWRRGPEPPLTSARL